MHIIKLNGNALREIRENAGMSLGKLATLLGKYTRQNINGWENSRWQPDNSVKLARELSKIFKVPKGDFLLKKFPAKINGIKLREIREKNGMRLRELAKKLGHCHPYTIRNWENMVMQPRYPVETITRLSEIFKVPREEFLLMKKALEVQLKGRKVREVREKAGMSLSRLATLLGSYNSQTVGSWERNYQQPFYPEQIASELSRIFKVPKEEFLISMEEYERRVVLNRKKQWGIELSGSKLREVRRKAGMGLKRLTKLLKQFSPTTINNWERNKHHPHYPETVASRLSEIFKIPKEDFLIIKKRGGRK